MAKFRVFLAVHVSVAFACDRVPSPARRPFHPRTWDATSALDFGPPMRCRRRFRLCRVQGCRRLVRETGDKRLIVPPSASNLHVHCLCLYSSGTAPVPQPASQPGLLDTVCLCLCLPLERLQDSRPRPRPAALASRTSPRSRKRRRRPSAVLARRRKRAVGDAGR